MKKLKHSKYKNAGILFELLVRQVTADILNGQEDSKANGILRKYFSESTELGRENRLYRIILEEKAKDTSAADRLLETILRTRKKLDEKALNVQKYNLVKEISRLLAYKLLVDSFNEKYKGLDDKQKVLIREYINNVSNTNSLREYINAEVPFVRAQIMELKSKVDNDVIKIKLDETLNQLDKITKGTLVKENQIMAMLLSYELIKELKNLK